MISEPDFKTPTLAKDEAIREKKVSTKERTRTKVYVQNVALLEDTKKAMNGEIELIPFLQGFIDVLNNRASEDQIMQLQEKFPFQDFLELTIQSQNPEIFHYSFLLLSSLLQYYEYGNDIDSLPKRLSAMLQPQYLDFLFELLGLEDKEIFPSLFSIISKIMDLNEEIIPQILQLNIIELIQNAPLSRYSVLMCDIIIQNETQLLDSFLPLYDAFLQSNDILVLSECFLSLANIHDELKSSIPAHNEEEEHEEEENEERKAINAKCNQVCELIISRISHIFQMDINLITTAREQDLNEGKQIRLFYEHFYDMLSSFPQTFLLPDDIKTPLIQFTLVRSSAITPKFVQNGKIYANLIQNISKFFINFSQQFLGILDKEISEEMFRFCNDFNFSTSITAYEALLQYLHIEEWLDGDQTKELFLKYAQAPETFLITIQYFFNYFQIHQESEELQNIADLLLPIAESYADYENAEIAETANQFIDYITELDF